MHKKQDFLQQTSSLQIEFIANTLSVMGRYNGYTSRFYSIAQHCVLTSFLVPEEHRMAALMHEAIDYWNFFPSRNSISDKRNVVMGNYHVDKFQSDLMQQFGVKRPLPSSIIYADLMMLATEKRDLGLTGSFWNNLKNIEPAKFRIKPQSPELAKKSFLDRFHHLNRNNFR